MLCSESLKNLDLCLKQKQSWFSIDPELCSSSFSYRTLIRETDWSALHTVMYLILHEQIERFTGQLPVQAVLDGQIHRLGLHFGFLGLWRFILLLLLFVFCWSLKVIIVTVNFPLQTLGVVEQWWVVGFKGGKCSHIFIIDVKLCPNRFYH